MRSECKEKYMCGIAGFYNAEGNYQQQKEKWASVLTSMHECLAHRGNDESGIYLSDMTGLSHARLSIRDIVTGCCIALFLPGGVLRRSICCK